MTNLSASYLGICVCLYDLISAKILNFILELSQVQHPEQQLYACGPSEMLLSSGKYSLMKCLWQSVTTVPFTGVPRWGVRGLNPL